MIHYEIRDREVASRLGLSEDDVRALRLEHLRQGADWEYVKKCARWTTAAFDRVAALLLEKTAPKPAPASSAGREALPSEVELMVWRADFKNRRVIECYYPATDPNDSQNRVVVRVSSAENFARTDWRGVPMKIRAVQTRPGEWENVGRCPRWPRRW